MTAILNGMSDLSKLTNAKTRSISAENFTGEKGRGGMATEGTGKAPSGNLGKGWKISPSILMQPGEVFELANIQGQGAIKHIWMTESAEFNRGFVIRMYWDGSDIPSVEVPVGDFFAAANHKTYTSVQSLAVCVNPRNGLNCYWEMPFYKGARITLENISDKEAYVYYQIDYILTELPEGCGYFHAQFRRSNPLKYKEVHTILDDVKGKGQYVGTYMFWGVNNSNWWGEGEIKFYLDGDDEYPTICGTGTEDYFCGSYNFDPGNGYENFTGPYAGFAAFAPDGCYQSQQRFSMYRWHITDPVYFDEDIKITIQGLGWRNGFQRYLPLQDDISSVAFWYLDRICDNMPKLPEKDFLEII